MSLSIDKIQNTESVAFMLLLQNYHRDCYIITPPSEEIMHPSSEIMVAPSSEIVDPSDESKGLTFPVECVKVSLIDPFSGY